MQGMVFAGGSHGIEDSAPVASGWLRLWQAGEEAELQSIYTGDSALSTIAMTNDYIISGDSDKRIKLWRRDGTLITTLNADSAVQALALSRDNSWIASGEAAGVEIWPLTGSDNVKPSFAQKASQIWAVSFDPQGARIALGSDREILACRIAGEKQGCDHFEHRGGKVFNIAFSPLGDEIATASGDNSVRLWDSHTYNELHRSTSHTKDVWGLAYNPTGDIIASAGVDRTIRLMRATDLSEPYGPMERHKGTISSVSFASDNIHLASGSLDHTMLLWDWKERTSIDLGVDERPVWWVSFSPNGKYLAAAGLSRYIRVWDMTALSVFFGAAPLTLVKQSEAHTGLALNAAGQVSPIVNIPGKK